MRAVIFDWGGTLTPWVTMDMHVAWRAYADVVHADDPEAADALAAVLRAADDAAWHRSRTDATAFHLLEMMADAGHPAEERALVALRAHWDQATYTDPEVAPLLAELRGRGLRTGVLSSTSWPAAWHEEILIRDGVRDLFDACVWSSDLEYTKPHRVSFETAMRAVGVDDPADCVYVGDRPHDDISGAKAAGMRAVFIPHSVIPVEQQLPVEVEPDAVLHRLSDLPAILDRWV
ncbi:HAD-superfamily hydrolase, subfamily IA, variant 1 [Alloactinosynnema sp. L-07]|uniref:HAD family hydrolase n=1 Tax=Alloactinosynnema sp. L-07 TaxID=1653480 RepID=UPI00065EFDE0|nr:HAD family hydrolase [Alloactinosynnema sp. L-07]CRK59962.1 HAD-superfamily hydrolase, subfamily IA, variant 1 [Alloactinosynnema sp. L-07]